jgi:hypothetical protein
MKKRRYAFLAVFLLIASTGTTSMAQTTTVSARAIASPFYDALNATPGKDVAALIRSATTQDWVSCGANDVCGPREDVIAGIAGLQKAIPDLKWSIKDVVVSENHIVVRGEASGTPAGEFMGVPHVGKSFKIMSIDIHTFQNGKITRSYHVEDWMSAVRQLTAK